MERTKLLFGYDQRLDASSSNHSTLQNNNSANTQRAGASNKPGKIHPQQQQQQQQQQQPAATSNAVANTSSGGLNNATIEANVKQLLEMLKHSPQLGLNKLDLFGALRNQSKALKIV